MSCSYDNNPLILPVGPAGPQGPQGEPGFGFEHFVGEEFGGGVVFHVYRDSLGAEHGLICSINDLSTNANYSNVTNELIIGTTSWNGQTNTNLMKIQGELFGPGSGAWKLCDDYSYDGFTDWYLPSVDELNLLANNRFNVGKTLSTISGADNLEVYKYYWSSTQDTPTDAWYISFGILWAQVDNKSNTAYVRAIRQF